MDDYIRHSDVLNEIHRFRGYIDEDMEYRMKSAINKIPSADVAEVRHGEWIDKTMSVPNGHGQTYGKYGCSVCKNKVRYKSNFCPNCGADMRGGI